MTRNKVKFSISIKDLSIEFEGDQQMGQSVQEGVQESLGHLLSAPSRVLGIEDKSTVDATAVRPAKRKRRPSPAKGEAAEGNGRSTRRAGVRTQIKELITNNFFSKSRKVEDVRAQLSDLGHNFKPSPISMALLALTKQKKLSRSKDSKGVYNYKAG